MSTRANNDSDIFFKKSTDEYTTCRVWVWTQKAIAFWKTVVKWLAKKEQTMVKDKQQLSLTIEDMEYAI